MGSKSFLGEFEQMVLLAVLQQGETAFALEVRREIEKTTERTVSRGAFYTTLDRLERKGFVSWTEETPEDPRSNAPLRRYRVTGPGLDVLRQSMRVVATLSRGLDGILGRLP